MFLIKNSQLETLSAIGREDFIKKMMKLLRDDFEEVKFMPLNELHDDISIQINKAQTYGFSLNTTLATYVTSSVVAGKKFDTDITAAYEILSSDFHEIEKSKMLEDLFIELSIIID
jgi:hypothetical protein